MEGKFYAIRKGATAPEIENAIDLQKYGSVKTLNTHPVYDRVIEAEIIDHPDAFEITKTELKELSSNYISSLIE